MRIQQLPLLVANQIAAGEVIERPASVVKELLENALDAGATELFLDIGFGGLNQIKLTDNGFGITADDLPLAIAPHATSKIRTLEDLAAVHSMGFRGEALASIAAVSRLEISSKTASQEHGARLKVDGNDWVRTVCAHATGTTLCVDDLFYNAPVRKKFLKSAAIEYQVIDALVKRFVLSAPHVGLTLRHNLQPMLVLPKNQEQFRIKKIFGQKFLDYSIGFEVERAGMVLKGRISLPQYQRSQNDKQFFYVNGRMVKDKLLMHAMKQAYEGFLEPGRFATYVLYLLIPTDQVDVNVHPTKHELRFLEPRLVHDFILSQIKLCLNSDTSSVMADKDTNIHINNNNMNSLNTIAQLNNSQKFSLKGEDKNSNFVKPLEFQENADSWFDLNGFYALALTHGRAYLINIYQWYLDNNPYPIKYPWPKRQLSVPVEIVLPKKQLDFVESILGDLEQYGIDVSVLGTDCILIRTIPLCVPLLDLHQFFQRLCTQNLSIALFQACCNLSLAILSEKDRQLCLSDEKYHKLLTVEMCHKIYEK